MTVVYISIIWFGLVCILSPLTAVHVLEVPSDLTKYHVEGAGINTDEIIEVTTEKETNDDSESSNQIEVKNVEDAGETNTTVNVEQPPEYNKHPCRRPCVNGKAMLCRYEFTIELFATMGKACFDCPYNKTHCESKHCIPGDGVERAILTVNRQMPGPSIDVCVGDKIEVRVVNMMMDISTTIHWHGLLQTETPVMDGVPFVSQCFIAPQSSFMYTFYADTSGTHIWHSHSAVQRGDGLYGPLIVREPPELNPHKNAYDLELSEHFLTIMDWVHKFSPEKFSLHIHAKGDNKPPSLLVNGKGRFQKFMNEENQTIYTSVATFNVKQGLRYRFRLINAGFLNCPIEMSIDNHNITVIATDGEYVQPREAESLVSLAGERYDFILNAKSEVKNYWIRFKGKLDCWHKRAHQVAVLHYEGAPNNDPEGNVTYETAGREGIQINSVNEKLGTPNTVLLSELSSLPGKSDPALRPKADYKFYVSYDFYPIDHIHFQKSPLYSFFKIPVPNRVATPQLNHISMKFPSFPLMTDLEKSKTLNYCNQSSISMECRFEFCECPHVLRIPLNSVVEIVLIDEGLMFDANHPFHLHGYKFRVIGMDRLGKNTTEEEVRILDKQNKLKRNLINPPFKDTVTVPDGGYTIIRFYANNPGYWIMHCHIDFHVELGMALLIKVGEESEMKPPPKNFPKCGDPYDPTIVKETHLEHQASFFPVKQHEHNYRYMGGEYINSSPISIAIPQVLFLLPLLIFFRT